MRLINLDKFIITIGIISFSSTVFANQSFQTSFDCAKAASEVEKTICSVKDLADADIQLGALYKSLLSSLPESNKSQLKNEQIHWLKNRNKVCSSSTIIIDCLKESYLKRNETLMKAWQQSIPTLPFNKNIVTTTSINIPLIYATEMTDGESLRILISKHEEKPIPVFGVPSHFYPYEGTSIRVEPLSKSLYLSYIGMRINNRQLVSKFNIQFKKITKSDMEEESDPKETSFLNNIIENIFQNAYACGPYFGYELTGNSELNFIREENGISWFKLLEPIDLSQRPTMMQLYYLPNHLKGKLTIELATMVLSDGNGNYLSPTFTNGEDVTSEELNYYHNSITSRNNYEAYLGNNEKGLITLNQNDRSRIIELTFKNNGIDPIVIDQQSLLEIEARLTSMSSGELSWRVKSISLHDLEGNVITSLSFDDIERKLLGQLISPGNTFSIPFHYDTLPTEKLYYFSVNAQETKLSRKRLKSDRDKVIYWQLGKSPYGYYVKNKEASPLYLVYANKDGSADIDEIGKDAFSYMFPGSLSSFLYKETSLQGALHWNRDQHVSALLNNPKDFSWAVIVPKSEVSSFIEHATSLVGNIKNYSGNLISVYRRDKYQSYVSTGVMNKREVGIIYEVPENWMSKPKLSQYLIWMIKANAL